MESQKDKKTIKIIRIIVLLLIIGAVIDLFISIIGYYLIINHELSLPATARIDLLIPYSIIWLLYILIVSFGLYKLRKWSLYAFAIPVVWFFFWGIIAFIGSGFQMPFNSEITLIGRIILGVMAIFIFRNRHLFVRAKGSKNEKIQSGTT